MNPARPPRILPAIRQAASQRYYSVLLEHEPTDVEFLRRSQPGCRGVPPSKVEENYFVEQGPQETREAADAAA